MGRQPDYRVNAYDKRTKAFTVVGAAWNEDGGRINIKLSPAVCLTYDPNLTITLFPNDNRGEGSRQSAAQFRNVMPPADDDEEPYTPPETKPPGDIPF